MIACAPSFLSKTYISGFEVVNGLSITRLLLFICEQDLENAQLQVILGVYVVYYHR